MNNKNLVLIGILVLIILMVGASLKKPLTKGLLSNGKILGVTISQSGGSAEQSSRDLAFTDKKAISIFINTITGAKKDLDLLDLASRDYTAVLSFENNKTKKYYLWLNDSLEQGKLMDAEDTSLGYKISKKTTEELKTLLKEAE